jgi:hypothetical protein
MGSRGYSPYSPHPSAYDSGDSPGVGHRAPGRRSEVARSVGRAGRDRSRRCRAPSCRRGGRTPRPRSAPRTRSSLAEIPEWRSMSSHPRKSIARSPSAAILTRGARPARSATRRSQPATAVVHARRPRRADAACSPHCDLPVHSRAHRCPMTRGPDTRLRVEAGVSSSGRETLGTYDKRRRGLAVLPLDDEKQDSLLPGRCGLPSAGDRQEA